MCVREHACGRYTPDNGRHPYGWPLGSAGNNGANFPLSPSILVGILYCRARCIYIYICMCIRSSRHIYIPLYICTDCSHPSKRSPERTCVLRTQSPTGCPTNQDLSLLPVVTDRATRARAPVYPVSRCRYHLCIIVDVCVIQMRVYGFSREVAFFLRIIWMCLNCLKKVNAVDLFRKCFLH